MDVPRGVRQLENLVGEPDREGLANWSDLGNCLKTDDAGGILGVREVGMDLESDPSH